MAAVPVTVSLVGGESWKSPQKAVVFSTTNPAVLRVETRKQAICFPMDKVLWWTMDFEDETE